MARPLIGVSTYLESGARWGVWELEAALLPVGYPRLVQRAGGLAAMLPPDDTRHAADAVARLDGLVIAGGPDVEPVRYGAEREPRTGPPAPERDAWELALIEAALLQHIEGHAEVVGVFGGHAVKPVPGSLYAGVVPEETFVPTYHHQAVDRLGEGLIPSAYAADGTVEAVELPSADWVLGVQWHPEMGEDVRVMRALVEAATGG